MHTQQCGKIGPFVGGSIRPKLVLKRPWAVIFVAVKHVPGTRRSFSGD